MEIKLKEFEPWSLQRIRLKHNWFDRLADIVRSAPLGGKLPVVLNRWREELPNLREWLGGAEAALSPRQVLDMPAFKDWPPTFRDAYKLRLHERFLLVPPRIGDVVGDCFVRLKNLDAALAPMFTDNRPVLTDERRATIAGMFENLARRMRDLPEGVSWPTVASDELPAIFVIDDLLGRVTAVREGGPPLSPDAENELRELRRSFCDRFHLIDNDFPDGGVGHPIARAHFCAGQKWEPGRGFVNDIEVVRRDLLGGNGGAAAWSLVIADILFNTGEPDAFGRGEGESYFGVERVIPWLRKNAPEMPVVALTTESGHSLIERIHRLEVEYLHRSESSYTDLLVRLARGKRASVAQLRKAIGVPADFVAEDPLMIDVLLEAWNVAQDEAGRTVLIVGEPGAGKERLAQFIHDASPRAGEKLIFVNCAQLSKELADSELFGYYAHAFTDAGGSDSRGKFHEAHRGTLVLDEFADLDQEVQVKLLRTLQPRRAQERPVEPRGNRRASSRLDTTVDVRVICCTNQPLDRVRKDLRTRVGKVISIPPLRERPGDINSLATYFLSSPDRMGRPNLELDAEASEFLKAADLPGNARTLEHLLEVVAVGKGKHNIIRRADLELAWKSAVGDLEDGYSSEPPARYSTPAAPPEVGAYGPLAQAVATLLTTSGGGARNWDDLSKSEVNALDDALQGSILSVIAVLAEWAFFRAADAPAVAWYITGERSKGRTPEDFIKRLLKLDQSVFRDIAASPHLPSNARLREIIDSCSKDWERRTRRGSDE